MQTSFFSGVMLVSMLTCGQGNYLCLEDCWEAGCMYVDGDVTSKPGSAVQVQGQTQDNSASLKGAAKVGLSLCPFLRGTTQDTLSALCRKHGVHRQRTDFGGANYKKADHIYTRSSQITNI